MNPRTKPTDKAPLSSLAAAQDQTPYTAFTHDFQELCSLAMDQAIGMEKASLDAVLRMQACVIDACDGSQFDVSQFDVSQFEAAACCTPALGSLFDLMAQAVASLMNLQLACLKMMTPHAIHKAEPVLHLVEPARKAATSVAAPALLPAPHALAHSMDIAIGAHAA